VKNRDKKIRQQHRELKQLGDLKRQTDALHLQQFDEAQQQIIKLKKQVEKLRERNRTNLDRMFQTVGSQNTPMPVLSPQQQQQMLAQHQQQMSLMAVPNGPMINLPVMNNQKSTITSVTEWKKRQNVMIPLRGGGKKKDDDELDENHGAQDGGDGPSKKADHLGSSKKNKSNPNPNNIAPAPMLSPQHQAISVPIGIGMPQYNAMGMGMNHMSQMSLGSLSMNNLQGIAVPRFMQAPNSPNAINLNGMNGMNGVSRHGHNQSVQSYYGM